MERDNEKLQLGNTARGKSNAWRKKNEIEEKKGRIKNVSGTFGIEVGKNGEHNGGLGNIFLPDTNKLHITLAILSCIQHFILFAHAYHFHPFD